MGPENSGQYELDFEGEGKIIEQEPLEKLADETPQQVQKVDETEVPDKPKVTDDEPFRYHDETSGPGKPKDRSGWN